MIVSRWQNLSHNHESLISYPKQVMNFAPLTSHDSYMNGYSAMGKDKSLFCCMVPEKLKNERMEWPAGSISNVLLVSFHMCVKTDYQPIITIHHFYLSL